MTSVDAAAAAITAVARQRVKQALAACRTAAQRLAAAQDLDVYAQRECTSQADVGAVSAVLELALTEHQAVHVVVLTTQPEPTAPTGAKETHPCHQAR